MKKYNVDQVNYAMECGASEDQAYVKSEVAERLMEAVKFAYLISEDEQVEKMCGDALRFANEN